MCIDVSEIILNKPDVDSDYFSDFEPEPGTPKQSARFLDVSFRGICTDAKGKQHPIEKSIIISKYPREFSLIHRKYLMFRSDCSSEKRSVCRDFARFLSHW